MILFQVATQDAIPSSKKKNVSSTDGKTLHPNPNVEVRIDGSTINITGIVNLRSDKGYGALNTKTGNYVGIDNAGKEEKFNIYTDEGKKRFKELFDMSIDSFMRWIQDQLSNAFFQKGSSAPDAYARKAEAPSKNANTNLKEADKETEIVKKSAAKPEENPRA